MLNRFINNPEVLNIYKYGSVVYGTVREGSDQDFIVIVSNDFNINDEQISENNCDFTLYSEDKWLEMIEQNHIVALECCSLSETFIIKQTKKFKYDVDLIATRIAISSIVSNSWVKGKKKFEVEKDYNPLIAKKSIWHCFRILMFGIQACKYGKIIDFKEANTLFKDIMEAPDNWEYFKTNYQQKLNELKTDFKKYSEKEWIDFTKNKI